ncbi:hypothetical protein SRB5_38150 [Streptomyces sp. RB5]|uniref:SMODS and SLOG-associating 2TM effector domain-containing protein n=2 Tax=Streptomyces smaragdinus TaxID=2585196 RepID=A0A7K0CJK1_9ACTN|nr:hypothetical protein [Streptomyces smaragdinus]
MPVSQPTGRTLAFLAFVAAGVAPLAVRGAAADRVRDWTRTRAVSEELKSQTYLRLARLTHYAAAADADAELADRAGRVLADAADLEPGISAIRPVDRPLPPVSDAATYAAERLRRQLEVYYRPKAREMARRAQSIERWTVALAVLSVLLGGVAGAFAVESAAAWMPVVAAVASAVAAHGATAKYVVQQVEFSRTTGELERLLLWWEQLDPATPADGDRLAERGEHVISVQNEGWMAKWTAD